jgi:hypothetical protein
MKNELTRESDGHTETVKGHEDSMRLYITRTIVVWHLFDMLEPPSITPFVTVAL